MVPRPLYVKAMGVDSGHCRHHANRSPRTQPRTDDEQNRGLEQNPRSEKIAVWEKQGPALPLDGSSDPLCKSNGGWTVATVATMPAEDQGHNQGLMMNKTVVWNNNRGLNKRGLEQARARIVSGWPPGPFM